MSDRTFERRFALFRASAMVDLRRLSSRRWSTNISRWRARLFCLTAEEECEDSESRRRLSWDTRVSLYGRVNKGGRSSVVTVEGYLFEDVLEL